MARWAASTGPTLSVPPMTKTKTIAPIGLRPLGSMLVVYPLWDADKVGIGERIWIPDDAKNPSSQQGYVVAKGPDSGFELMDLIVYHPNSATDNDGTITFRGEQYLRIWDHHVVGKIHERDFLPRSGYVVIEPEWDNLGETIRPSGIVLIDPTVHNAAEPPRFGKVTRCGDSCGVLSIGDSIVIPPIGGLEIGWIDRVIYAIPERDILARLEPK